MGYQIFLTIACLLAAIGAITDSPVTVVGAMVLGPEFGPLAAVAVGMVLRRGDLIARGAIALAVGFPLAMAVTAAATVIFDLTGLLTAGALDRLDDVEFIYQVGPFSFIIAVLAGVAGMLAITSAKSASLVGVFISVTTVPAAAFASVALVEGRFAEALSSVVQLGGQPRRDRRRRRAQPARGSAPPSAQARRTALVQRLTRHGATRDRSAVTSAALFGQGGEELVDLLPDARTAGQPLPFPAHEGDEGEAVVDRHEPVLASSAGRVHQQRFHLGRHVGQRRAATPRRRATRPGRPPSGSARPGSGSGRHGAAGAGDEEGQADRHAQTLGGHLRQAEASTGYEPVVPVAGGLPVEQQRARLADAADLAAVGVEEVPVLVGQLHRAQVAALAHRSADGAPVG